MLGSKPSSRHAVPQLWGLRIPCFDRDLEYLSQQVQHGYSFKLAITWVFNCSESQNPCSSNLAKISLPDLIRPNIFGFNNDSDDTCNF